MSNKNKSKKPSSKVLNADEGRRKLVKDSPAKEEIVVERKEESSSTLKPTPAPTSTPLQKPADAPIAKPKIEETPWSEWIWDDVSGQWYRARLGHDKTWQYDFPEPSAPVLLPGPVPQFAPVEKFEYAEPESKFMFANEVVYEVPDSRGGYLLAVRQDKCIWNLEETKAKDGPKKADSSMEKKEGGGESKSAATNPASQNPSTERKVPPKSSVEAADSKKTVGIERVREWRAQFKDAAQKEANGSIPESSKKQGMSATFTSIISGLIEEVPETDRKLKQSSKAKKKTAYIESDEEDEPRHRGRPRERRK
ncbi:hypothetical protein BKA64DRAFT_646762 [Cadophora sp. MPI-SDFR-AT-0126]|nr:hypothetical protein BKA64DRAFT_646762 [Leotiomycetes sp. MPI-SDFR-AT-0126]